MSGWVRSHCIITTSFCHYFISQFFSKSIISLNARFISTTFVMEKLFLNTITRISSFLIIMLSNYQNHFFLLLIILIFFAFPYQPTTTTSYDQNFSWKDSFLHYLMIHLLRMIQILSSKDSFLHSCLKIHLLINFCQ